MVDEDDSMSTKAQRVRKIIFSLIGIYLGLTLVMFLLQRQLLYYPFPEPPGAPSKIGLDMQVVNVTTDDGLKLLAWYAPPKNKDLPVVLVYHGNGATIAYRGPIASAMMKKGYGVFLCEYRGFAGNPGSPTEQGLYTDGRAAIKWLQGKGYKDSQLVYYGESLGSGVAVQMALEKPPVALVLQSSYSSTVDVASHKYWFLPVNLLMLDRFESISKIAKVKVPLLVIHGDADTFIPIALPKKLFEAANQPKEFISLPGAGHNDTYDHGAGPAITGWIEKQLKKR